MGKLIGMAYPTKLFLKQADHTYVKCGSGKRVWSCWGGKTGGKPITQGNASTKRADAIAGPDEKAGIKCYLINGVCHQAANRILMPALTSVKTARGYSVSVSLFGTYGRVGFWPCKSPFKKFPNMTGDLKECVEPASSAKKATPLTDGVRLERQYLKGVLELYNKAEKAEKTAKAMGAEAIKPAEAKAFHVELFMHMADFQLANMLDEPLMKNLKEVRSKTEVLIVKNEVAFKNDRKSVYEFIDTFNEMTIRFQNEMASIMNAEAYEALFDQKREEKDHVLLADPEILKKIYDIDVKELSKWYKMSK